MTSRSFLTSRTRSFPSRTILYISLKFLLVLILPFLGCNSLISVYLCKFCKFHKIIYHVYFYYHYCMCVNGLKTSEWMNERTNRHWVLNIIYKMCKQYLMIRTIPWDCYSKVLRDSIVQGLKLWALRTDCLEPNSAPPFGSQSEKNNSMLLPY